jgi:hypothetical protein
VNRRELVEALALRDAHARVVRALEAVRDGDLELAEHLLDDLGEDLWRRVERREGR